MTSAAASNVEPITRKRGRPVGRQDKEGQEAVIKLAELQSRIDDLVVLHGQARDAATAYSESVKATAEKAGLLASVVRKFIAARASERFDDHRKHAEQLALVFDEIGIISGGRLV